MLKKCVEGTTLFGPSIFHLNFTVNNRPPFVPPVSRALFLSRTRLHRSWVLAMVNYWTTRIQGVSKISLPILEVQKIRLTGMNTHLQLSILDPNGSPKEEAGQWVDNEGKVTFWGMYMIVLMAQLLQWLRGSSSHYFHRLMPNGTNCQIGSSSHSKNTGIQPRISADLSGKVIQQSVAV